MFQRPIAAASTLGKKSIVAACDLRVPHACRQFALGLSPRWPTLLMCFN
jgi:hypothetical protein